MTLLLAFGLVLMLAVLVSERAQRTVLSTAVVFLWAGLCLGEGGLGWVVFEPGRDVVGIFAELALFAILFVDGSELSAGELGQAWRLPGRALLLGMPLTIVLIALAAHWVLGASWAEAFLVGAILSPTDPVFVSAILDHEAVPARLRHVLRVESGLNDGIALPLVTILLSVVGHRDPDPMRAVLDALAGSALGVSVPLVFLWLERRRVFGATSSYRSLAGVAIACVLFGSAQLLHVNVFLAAFAGGVTLATVHSEFAVEFRALGAPLAEALKLAALLVFGAKLRLPWLVQAGASGLLFAAIALVAARPVALVFAFIGGPLERKEWLAAAWFGPKGFASLLYALLLLHAGLPRSEFLFRAVALVIVSSIVAHSSTDVVVARVFRGAATGTSRHERP